MNQQGGQGLPDIDVDSMIDSYQEVKDSGSQPKIITDMFGLLLHMASKHKETEGLKDDIRSNTDRIDMIEAKIGGPDEVSERLSIAIRNLPIPIPGNTEIDCVRNALHEIRAQGVDVHRDVIKVVRKVAANNPSGSLGTVMVELRNEETRAAIMKSKKNLSTHTSPTLKNLIIKNAKSKDRMFIENCTNSLLKLSHGDNFFIAGNGMIKKKDENNSRYGRQFNTNPEFRSYTNSPRYPHPQRNQFQPQPGHYQPQPGYYQQQPGQYQQPQHSQYQPQPAHSQPQYGVPPPTLDQGQTQPPQYDPFAMLCAANTQPNVTPASNSQSPHGSVAPTPPPSQQNVIAMDSNQQQQVD